MDTNKLLHQGPEEGFVSPQLGFKELRIMFGRVPGPILIQGSSRPPKKCPLILGNLHMSSWTHDPGLTQNLLPLIRHLLHV